MSRPPVSVGDTADARVPSSDPELARVVSLLLSTQQELIDLRHRRDREHRVLEGIVGFTEMVQPRTDKQGFWDAVVDATVKTFDCESSLAVEWNGTDMTVLASRGPAPATPDEAAMLYRVAVDCVARRVVLLEDGPVHELRFGGRGIATLLVVPIEGEPRTITRFLILTVSTRKQAFFPRFDDVAVPGLRMFAATVGGLREMYRTRSLIQDQVQELDRTNGELAHRMAEERRSADDREQLRAQLAQSRRMESIGRLAGGVAHDFNNLLMVIFGNAELIKDDPALPMEHRESIDQVLAASGRAQALTQQLLMFSRKQVIRPLPMLLNQQIEESLRLYRRIIGEDIALTFVPCAEDTTVLADRQQFDQLLSNLLLNARDAIHEVPLAERLSEIRVATALVLENSPLHGGVPAVRLTVADTGTGMDEDTRQNIFEPFFSTKETGKGTGLGLATVLGIIQQNRGTIDVHSEVRHGSVFHVYWPIHLANDMAPTELQRTEAPGIGTEHVFLVEDEDQVRAFMVRGLQRLGFQVTAFASGDAALAGDAASPAPPDVLVTDVVMPRMNGRQLAEAMRARHPSLPVLFVSGYTDDIVAQQGIIRDGVELLQKPFGPDALGQRIRRILDARRAVQS